MGNNLNEFTRSCQKPISITTRIKTKFRRIIEDDIISQKPISITTRIKTLHHFLIFLWSVCQKPISITTRIKTIAGQLIKEATPTGSETHIHYNKD